jgi:acetyl-CoA synthetase
MDQPTGQEAYRACRDILVRHGDDYEAAVAAFRWPDIGDWFNWALDWFDPIAAGNPRTALRVMVMLGNQVELWESMLAVMKLGAVIMPATTALGPNDLADRVGRGAVRHVITSADQIDKFTDIPGDFGRIAIGDAPHPWRPYRLADAAAAPSPLATQTRAEDPMLIYLTSGTTSQPKLVEHTHRSYPVGHLSTMYFLGLRPGDVHLNISSPGWAKHAWSSFFAPWIAESTILVYNYTRFDASRFLTMLHQADVTSVRAPPTVWRMLIQANLGAKPPCCARRSAQGSR